MAFSSETLRFFRGLARRNEKPWFEAHRDDYEQHVRGPMRELVEEMDVRLARFAPEIVGDPRRSIFRIHRDIRFSRDKSPYKTHIGAWFYHRDATRKVGQDGEGGSAGFYVQIAPGDSFTGGGIWMPPRPALARIRDAIAENPRAFARIADHPALQRRLGGLSREDALKRTPRGYAPDHPATTWLRLQSFTTGRTLSDTEAVNPRLVTLLERQFLLMLPLVRWLNGALGLRPASRR
ncbi:MAG TPA: DUF2461 domain-containing protein [Gemmatimonadales bacterium]